MGRTVLVAGALGVVGRAVQDRFVARGVPTICLSRRTPDRATAARFVSVDLLDPSNCAARLTGLDDVTHLVYCAYADHGGAVEDTAPNLAMLSNLMTVIERACPRLRHVTLMQGAKAYGSHLGPFRTPARESAGRHMPPNFYFDQADLLEAMQRRGVGWHVTILRPTTVYGFSLGSSMNLTTVIAVYGAISKALGLPLRFPGTAGAYEVIRQGVDAGLLAEVVDWAGEAQAAQDETFNVTNGDVFRWSGMWPHVASLLGMPVEEPQRLPLAPFMADKAGLWNAIAEQHQLRRFPFAQLVSWQFGTRIFEREYDSILDTNKLRKAGFSGFRDSVDMFAEQIARLREDRIIPA